MPSGGEVRGPRLAAGLIDALLIAAVFVMIGFAMRGAPLPPLFLVAGRLAIAAYLLLRDVTGASFGKRRKRLLVAAADGGRAAPGSLVLRNVTFAIAPLSAGIPVATLLAWVLVAAEVVLVALGRPRLGDLLAQTQVVERPEM